MSNTEQHNNVFKLRRLFYLPALIFYVFLPASLVYIGIGFANQGDTYPSTPETVVKKFCQLDAQGQRLSSDTMASILSLVTWTETGSEVMAVISNFKVGKVTIVDFRAKVPVEYEVLGSTDSIDFLEAPKRKSKITFELTKQNGVWKIDGPVIVPHVDWKVAVEHLRLLQKDEPARKEQLELVIQKIMKAKEKIKNKKVGE